MDEDKKVGGNEHEGGQNGTAHLYTTGGKNIL